MSAELEPFPEQWPAVEWTTEDKKRFIELSQIGRGRWNEDEQAEYWSLRQAWDAHVRHKEEQERNQREREFREMGLDDKLTLLYRMLGNINGRIHD